MFLALIGVLLFVLSFCLEPVIKLLQAKKLLDKTKVKSNNLGNKFKGGKRILDKFKIGNKHATPSEKKEKAPKNADVNRKKSVKLGF